MRLSDLRDKAVRTLDGDRLGRVHEVQCDEGRIVALLVGPGSLLERLTGKKLGRRIAWECVVKVDGKRVLVAPDRPQRARPNKATASRSRQGTRRTSAPRSRR